MVSLLPSSYRLTPAFSGGQGPLVFASPHSGQVVPEDMRPAAGLDLSSVNSACDVAVDVLLAEAPRQGVPLITGQISRAYVDLNRAPHEIDPELLADAPDGQPVSSKTRAGFGVVPRLSGLRQPLYDRALTLTEIEARLARVHAPYHQALGDLMHRTKQQAGRAILIDWHSMPGRATGATGADVVLGDRYGSACATEITRHLRSLFEALGWRVALNHPYAGGYSTQVWGRPDEGFEAIQIELSRKLSWDEAKGEAALGWRRCQSGLNRVIKGLIEAYPA
jgi:N-formylglutamate amidohydrolase